MMGLPRMLKLREASDATGLSYAFLRQLCLSGELPSVRSGSRWFINEQILNAYLQGVSVTGEQ